MHTAFRMVFQQPCVLPIATAFCLTQLATVAFGQLPPSSVPSASTEISLDSSQPSHSGPAAASAMSPHSVQIDPLNSPHPIPWNWVLANLSEANPTHGSQTRYYRSQSLVSPDGKYAAYSRIQIQLRPQFLQSRVSSVLFLENLKTGDLKTVTASSPLSDAPANAAKPEDMAGTIAIVIPVAWSETGDRVLAREFESLLGSDIASDYALIWDRQLNRVSTVAPTRIQYTNAVLLGWSQSHPGQALFRAGMIGEEQWPLWTVDLSGQTTAAPHDKPVVFGRPITSIWTGPQAAR